MALGYLLKIPAVSDYIFEADFDAAVAEIVKKFELPVERSEEFLDLINAVLDDVITPKHLPDMIAQAFGVDEAKAKAISADLLGMTILPLAAYVPDVEAGIVELGGKISDYPDTRIAKETKENVVVLKEIIESLKIPFSDVLLKRLLFLLQQFSRGEKTEEVLKTYFTRSLNIGGLGLDEEQATALLAATLPRVGELTEVAGTKGVEEVSKPVPEVEGAVEPAKQELEIAPSHELAAEVPVASAPVMVKARVPTPPNPPLSKVGKPLPESDVNELKSSAKKATVVRKMTENKQELLMAAVTLALTEAGEVLKKNKISDKVFIDLADKAVRGLRDIYQTRDIVERDWQLKGGDLATLMAAVARGVDSYQASVVGSRLSGGETNPESRIPNPDETVLEKQFSKLTDKSDGKIAPAKASLTVGSTVPRTADGQRKMVDVVSSMRLAGPVEQLGKMTPVEFRRLSSSAAEAAQKVDDLLTALQSTSYEERVKGVQAWRESPMNQLYLEIAEEALAQGLALPEISSRRRAAGQESLSPAEIKALALLNAKIRF